MQRVVQLVRDPGDKLTQGRQLLGLRQPLAQLLPLGLEPRLRRQVPRHHDAANAFPLLVEQVGDRHHERTIQDRIDEFTHRRRLAIAPHG